MTNEPLSTSGDYQPDRHCTNCDAPWHDLMDTTHDTFTCLRCGHIMALEATPDAPDDLL